MTCVQHGHWISAQVLDATFGQGNAALTQAAAAAARLTPRKCPDERYEMSAMSNESGTVQADGCGRCGGLWIPLALIEQLRASTPVNAATDAEARSLLALGAARALVPVRVARHR